VMIMELNRMIDEAVNNVAGDVTVHGKVSDLRTSGGHIFCRIVEDGGAGIRAILWRHEQRKIRADLSLGQDIACSGRVSIHHMNGSLSLIIKEIADESNKEVE